MANMSYLIEFYGKKVINGDMTIEEVQSLYRNKVAIYVEEHSNTNTNDAD